MIIYFISSHFHFFILFYFILFYIILFLFLFYSFVGIDIEGAAAAGVEKVEEVEEESDLIPLYSQFEVIVLI